MAKKELLGNDETQAVPAVPATEAPITETPEAPEAPVASENGGLGALLASVDKNMPELQNASEEEKLSAAADLLEKFSVFNEKMEELFKSEPMLGALISAVTTGKKKFIQAMAEIITPEEYEDLLESEGEDVQKSRGERVKKLDGIEKENSAKQANVEKSATNLENWLEDKKDWDDAKKEDFLNKIMELFSIMADGEITEKEFDAIANMVYMDEVVSAAKEEGMLVGRNEQISDKRVKEKVKTTTDGLPELNGGGEIPEGKAKPKSEFDDVVEYKNRPTW